MNKSLVLKHACILKDYFMAAIVYSDLQSPGSGIKVCFFFFFLHHACLTSGSEKNTQPL